MRCGGKRSTKRTSRTWLIDTYGRPTLSVNCVRSSDRRLSEIFTNYIRDNADEFRHIEFSEQVVEVPLGDGVSLKGRIDLVRRTDKDQTTIVDLKSNERSHQEDVTETQLHTYALGYKTLTGRNPDFVETYELKERAPKSRVVNEKFIDDVRRKTKKAASAPRKMRLEPAPVAKKCGECDFSSLCSASLA